MNENIIYIDHDFKDFVPTFIEKKLNDLVLIENHIEAGDYMAIKKIIHKLKGSSGGYGFKIVYETCKLIEDLCQENDGQGIEKHLVIIRSQLTESKIVYIDY